jgi:hypothetical protein
MAEIDLDRVKRNVGRMIDLGAPDEEIDAYLTDEGTTPDALRAHKAEAKPGVVRDVVSQTAQGLNRGFDATINLPGTLLNLGAKGINYGAEKLGYEARLPEQPFEPVRLLSRVNSGDEPATTAGRIAGSVGEAVGGTVVPSVGIIREGAKLAPQAINAGRSIIARAAQAPKATLRNDMISAVGAGTAVGAAREGDLGPWGELAAGIAGGVVAPNLVNAAARAGGALKEGARYGNRQVQRAINPQDAAIDDVADAMVAAKTMPNQVLQELVPAPSPNFQARGIGQPQIADMIARSHAGETTKAIASRFGVSEGAVSGYLTKYRDSNPLPRNLIDVGKELRGEGGAKPLADEGRTAMAISGDSDAAKRLTDRQYQQPGRVTDTIQQTGIQGRNYDDEVERLAGIAKPEERAAYAQARQNAQPIDLKPVIGTMRRRAVERQGEIAEQMNKAADLFFEPELAVPPQSPAAKLRMTEMQERVADATAKGASPDTIARLQRRLDVARQQDDFSRAARQKKVGQPLTDLGQYLDARQELDQMIARSMQEGKATPLTRELTAFRTRINDAARRNNKDLEAADLKFSENRTSERVLADGASLGKTLNQRSRQAIRDFRKMTPTQQETFRVGFERQMADDALRVPRGNAAARQFNNEAFDAIVEELYPKSAGKAVYQRGQALLRNLRSEAVSTDTINDVMRGSRTAPLSNSIAEQKEMAQTAANTITGRLMKVTEDLANRLARQIGQKAASERLKILTTVDPDELFPLLVRLEKSAKSSAERQAYVMAIREYRRARLSPASIGQTGYMAGQESGRDVRDSPPAVTIRPRP